MHGAILALGQSLEQFHRRLIIGRHCRLYGCHVGHWDEIDGLVDAAYEKFGKVDILVNNAGMSPLYPSLASIDEALFDKVVGLNLKGPFRLTALIGERMTQGDGGAEHVDLMPTTQTIWDIFWNKIQPQQRFMEESSDVAKIGFMSLRWNGAQITVDQYAPSGNLYGFNTKHIQLWISTLPKYQFGFTGFKEAQNTDDVAGQYLFAGNLLWTGPRLGFRIKDITG